MRYARMSALLALVTLAILLAGCGATASAGSNSNPTIKTKSVTIDGKATTVLSDTNGHTLYVFTPDTTTTVTCTGSCASLWPPALLASGDPVSPSGLSGKLSTVDSKNGRQLTYNGHPLYTFSKDKDEGDAYGQGFNGKWFVATTDIPVLSPSSSDTGGY